MVFGETATDPAAESRLTVDVQVPPAPAPVRIVLGGELDGEEVGRLHRAVLHLPIEGDRRDLRIDAAELTFLDSAGIRALLVFRARAEESGVRVVIGPMTRNVRRVLEIAGLTGAFHIDDPAATD